MGGSSTNYGGVINQVWGGIFPPVCTGSQNPENYFSNTYVLPSVNRTAGPMKGTHNICTQLTLLGTIFTRLFLSFYVQSQLALEFFWYWRKKSKAQQKETLLLEEGRVSLVPRPCRGEGRVQPPPPNYNAFLLLIFPLNSLRILFKIVSLIIRSENSKWLRKKCEVSCGVSYG